MSEYKRYQWRPILEKGGGGRDCPGIWLHPATNDIMVRIATEGNVYTDIFYRNFPLRKWFTFAIYINNMNAEIYIDGYLVQSSTVGGMPVTNNNFVNIGTSGNLGHRSLINNLL